MDFKELVARKLAESEENALSKEEQIHLEDDYYQATLKEWGFDTTEKVKKIPRFFHRLPRHNEVLRQKLREETRTKFLHQRNKQLITNSELHHLWELLDQSTKNSSLSETGGTSNAAEDQMLGYDDFCKIVEQANDKLKPYLQPSVFAKLQQGDAQCRISVVSLFNYAMRKVWLQQTRIGLSIHDPTGQGYLRETDLEAYISDLILTLPQLEGLDVSFNNFYICTAVRKFIFFLGTPRTGHVRILDILTCSFLDDLLDLRDENQSIESQEQNWFSAKSALRVYGDFLNLDRDHNGMLSLAELAAYGSGTLTKPFLERVFQVCLTYEKEMDYKTYLDLVLALENRSEPKSIEFLFRVLDLNSNGYLDAFTLSYFYRAIHEQHKNVGGEPPLFDDVKDELFDMIKPKNSEYITLNDVIASGQGETFVSNLIEFNMFWAYEHREYMPLNQSDDTQD